MRRIKKKYPKLRSLRRKFKLERRLRRRAKRKKRRKSVRKIKRFMKKCIRRSEGRNKLLKIKKCIKNYKLKKKKLRKILKKKKDIRKKKSEVKKLKKCYLKNIQKLKKKYKININPLNILRNRKKKKMNKKKIFLEYKKKKKMNKKKIFTKYIKKMKNKILNKRRFFKYKIGTKFKKKNRKLLKQKLLRRKKRALKITKRLIKFNRVMYVLNRKLKIYNINKDLFKRKYILKYKYLRKKVFTIINKYILKGMYSFLQMFYMATTSIKFLPFKKLLFLSFNFRYYSGQLLHLIRCLQELLFYTVDNTLKVIYFSWFKLYIYILLFVMRSFNFLKKKRVSMWEHETNKKRTFSKVFFDQLLQPMFIYFKSAKSYKLYNKLYYYKENKITYSLLYINLLQLRFIKPVYFIFLIPYREKSATFFKFNKYLLNCRAMFNFVLFNKLKWFNTHKLDIKNKVNTVLSKSDKKMSQLYSKVMQLRKKCSIKKTSSNLKSLFLRNFYFKSSNVSFKKLKKLHLIQNVEKSMPNNFIFIKNFFWF